MSEAISGATPRMYTPRISLLMRATCPTGKSVNWLSSPHAKNISLKPSGKSALSLRPSRPDKRGARDRHETWDGMRWTRMLRLTSVAEADGEVVWSRRPDAGVKSCGKAREAMVARKPGRQGERVENRKTIAQGKPGCLG